MLDGVAGDYAVSPADEVEATPTIVVGSHQLLPNTPGQLIPISVSGGDSVQGINLFTQIADGAGSQNPVIESLDILSGTIFAGNNSGVIDADGAGAADLFARWEGLSTTTAAGTVVADGLVGVLSIDTTGVNSGNWDLLLTGTVNGDTDFAGVAADVINGSIGVTGPEDDAYLAVEDTALSVIAPGLLANDGGVGLEVIGVDTTGTAGQVTAFGADGSFTYMPAAGAVGTDTFAYTVEDEDGTQATATVTITVTPNVAPVIEIGTHVLDADTPGQEIQIHVSGGRAVQGLEFFLQVADGGPENPGGAIDGPVITNADVLNGTIFDGNNTGEAGAGSILPQFWQSGTTTEQNMVAADGLLATVTIDTSGFLETNLDNPWELKLIGTIMGDSGFPFVPTTIANGFILLGSAPVAVDDTAAADEDGPAVTIDVLANDSDPDGDPISIIGFDTTSAMGAAVTAGGGGLVYDPTASATLNALSAGETAVDTFTYTIDDGQGGTDTATVSVTVTGENDGPTADDDGVGTDQATAVDLTAAILANDADPDANDVLEVGAIDDTGTTGTVTLVGGVVTYDPAGQFDHLQQGQTATDSFGYTVSDGNGGTDQATVTVTVTAELGLTIDVGDHLLQPNRPGQVIEILVEGGKPVQGVEFFLQVADGGPEAPGGAIDGPAITDVDVLTGTIFANNNDGEAGHGSIIPQFWQSGTVTDRDSDPDTVDAEGLLAVVTIDTTGFYVDDVNHPWELKLTGTLMGDSDFPFADVPITIANGTISLVADIDPVGGDDTAAANEDGPAVIVDVLANDSDPNGDPISVVGIDTTATAGQVTNNGTDVTYDPNGAFESLAQGATATDSFGYAVGDDNGNSGTGTVTVTITGQNDGPTAVDDTNTTDEDTPLSVNGVLDNDTDVDAGDTKTVVEVNGAAGDVGSQFTLPSGALLTLNADGTYQYDPNGQFESLAVGDTYVDTFTYTMADGLGATATASVEITITGANDGPTAVDDADATDEDNPLVVAAAGVLANDTDPDVGDSKTVTEVNGVAANVGTQLALASGALLTVGADGNYQYDPNGRFEALAVGETATDTFTYTMADGAGAADSATVTITIHGGNDDPTAEDDADETDEDHAVKIPFSVLLANDSDVDASDILTVGSVGGIGTLGTITLDTANEVVIYDPNEQFEHLDTGETETDAFTYTAADPHGGTATATVTITINGLTDGFVGDFGPGDEGYGETHHSTINDALCIMFDIGCGQAGSASAAPSPADAPVYLGEIHINAGTYDEQFPIPVGLRMVLEGDVTVGSFHGDGEMAMERGNLTTGIDDLPTAFSGEISGDNDLTKTGTAIFTLDGVNIHTGQTLIEVGAVALGASNVLPDASTVVISDGASLNLDGNADAIGGLGGEGTVSLGSGELTVGTNDDSTDFPGLIEGTGSLVKDGEGTLTLVGDNTYTGTTTVAGGTLAVSGSLAAGGDVSVADGGTLGGTGTLGGRGVSVAEGGSVAPGLSPGTLATGAVDFVAGSSFDVELNGPLPGTGYDQLDVTGTVTLTDALLGVSVGYAPAPGQAHTIIVNDGADAVIGTFLDLAEGAAFTADGVILHVTYAGDTGNDVVLTVNRAPVLTDSDPTLAGITEDDVDGAGQLVSAIVDSDLTHAITDADGDTGGIALIGTAVTSGNGTWQYSIDGGANWNDVGAVSASQAILLRADDRLRFVPDGENAATGSVAYRAWDQTAGAAGDTGVDTTTNGGSTALSTASDTATISVAAVPDDPTADDDTGTTDEDSTVSIDVLTNDADVDLGDTLTVTATNLAATTGTVTINPGGTGVTYDPNGQFDALAPGETAVDTFGYTVTDGTGGTATATVTVTVTGEQDAPLANGDTATTNEDTAVNVDVLSNDTDPEGDTLTVVHVDAVSAKGATIGEVVNGTYSYDPSTSGQLQALNPGEDTTDTFSYTVSDGQGNVSLGTVTVTVTGETDDAPTIIVGTNYLAPDTAGQAVEFSVSGGHLVQGVNLYVQIAAGAAADNPVIESVDIITGTIFETNNVGVTDADGSGAADAFPRWEGVITVTAAGTVAAQGLVGTALIDTTGVASGTWDLMLTGTIGGDSDFAGQQIQVTNGSIVINDPPTAVDDVAAADEDGPAVSVDVLANDTDPENDPLSVLSVTQGTAGGSVTNQGTQVTYDPDGAFEFLGTGQTAIDTFTYTATDNKGGPATATVTVTVTGENDTPTAVADTDTTGENSIVTVDVLANDTDPDANDNPANFSLDSATLAGGSGGAVSIVGNQLRFDPGSDFDGLATGAQQVVTVNYTMSDDEGVISSSTATITVTGVNDPPTAVPDSASTNENTVALVDVLTNDTDPDDASFMFSLDSVSLAAGGSGGSVSILGNLLRFDPGTDFDHLATGQQEVVTVNYTMSDDDGAPSASTATITVTGLNDPPVANPDSDATGENTAISVDVLANDTDPDDAPSALSLDGATLVPGGSGGTVTVEDGEVLFDPGTDFDHLGNGETEVVTINYTMSDDDGASSASTATITVNGVNDAPVANPDSDATGENAAISVDVLANDTDVDDAPAALSLDDATLVPGGSGGTVSVDGGEVLFDPGTDFDHLANGESEVVTINYTMSDDGGESATSTLSITVAGANDAPTANVDTGGTTEDAPVTVDVLANDTDPDDDAADLSLDSVTLVGGGSGGTVSIVGNELLFEPGSDFDHLAGGESEVVTVNYTMSDDEGAFSNSTATITVTGENDPPAANADADGTDEDNPVNIDVLGNDTDPEDDVLSVLSVTQGTGGGVVTNNSYHQRAFWQTITLLVFETKAGF